ncbi:MAG: hypothetical protein HY531_03630 [Chloroflexi bacterium]|nr:hypothetical protein [Chloroflexota bacterium]
MNSGARILQGALALALVGMAMPGLFLLDRFLIANHASEWTRDALGINLYNYILLTMLLLCTFVGLRAITSPKSSALFAHSVLVALVALMFLPTILAHTSFPWPALLGAHLRLIPTVSSLPAVALAGLCILLAFTSRDLLRLRLRLIELESNGADKASLLGIQWNAVVFYLAVLSFSLLLAPASMGLAIAARATMYRMNGQAITPTLLLVIPVLLLLALAAYALAPRATRKESRDR